MTTVQLGIAIITGIGLVAAGIGYGYGQFIKGKRESAAATIDLLTKQVEALQALGEDNAKEIVVLKKNMTAMSSLLDEKEKRISEYLAIFQNRDPQLQDFMKLATKAIIEDQNQKKETTEILTMIPQIHTTLQEIHKALPALSRRAVPAAA